MTATADNVIPLFSRGRQPQQRSSCQCRAGQVCYPHRVANVLDVVAAFRTDHAGELLLDAVKVDELLAYLDSSLGAIVSECLPDEAPAPADGEGAR